MPLMHLKILTIVKFHKSTYLVGGPVDISNAVTCQLFLQHNLESKMVDWRWFNTPRMSEIKPVSKFYGIDKITF